MSNTSDPMNRGGFYAFIFCMLFSFAFFIWVAVIYPGVDLKEVPEVSADGSTPVAAESKAKAVDVASVENPWMSSEAMIAHGKTVYMQNCQVCHGASGKGDGPGGKTVPPPRNLIEGKWKAGGDRIALFKTLQNGLAGTTMAAFKHIKVNDRWALVHWIRSVTENKVEDDDAKVETFAKTAD